MKSRQRKDNLIKILLSAIVFVGLIFCFTGCRERIVSDTNADRIEYEEVTTEIPTPKEDEKKEEPSNSVPENLLVSLDEQQTQSTKGVSGHGDDGSQKSNGDGTASGGLGVQSETAQTVSVSLNPNGGQVFPRSLECTLGKAYGSLPNASRNGYSFVGWFTQADSGVRITADTVVTNSEAHTLYAHWTTQSSVKLTFNPTSGWLGSKEKSRQIYTGQIYGNEFPKPTNYKGYEFKGWYTQETGGSKVSAKDVFSGTRDITLYAQWGYNAYSYWSGVLENCHTFPCQIQRIYAEDKTDNIAISSCSLITMTRSINASKGGELTDEQIRKLNFDTVIKVADNMGNAVNIKEEMLNRLGTVTYVVPSKAVYGSQNEKLYYALAFGKIIYPSAYKDVDLSKARSELGITSAEIYH